jgi:hypothetical protein
MKTHKDNLQVECEKLHPAAEWAIGQYFDATAIDCTTAVVLKILDGKCKMLPGEKAAILEIYDVVRTNSGVLFDEPVHQLIERARKQSEDVVLECIHELRQYAEMKIPRPVMKKYKAMLRTGLFG